MQYTEGKEEFHIIAVDPVSTDMVPCNTHWRRLLVVIDGSERVKLIFNLAFPNPLCEYGPQNLFEIHLLTWLSTNKDLELIKVVVFTLLSIDLKSSAVFTK